MSVDATIDAGLGESLSPNQRYTAGIMNDQLPPNQVVTYIIIVQCLCYGPLLIWQIWRYVKDTRRWKREARQRIDDDFERRIAALEDRMYHRRAS
jgi:hypothetical protein